jgi:cob(I)alamin adenosyltransferase
MRKGLVQIYTGEGKGKTTAAVGLAIRAAGHALRVCFLYFHKEPKDYEYGEFLIMEKAGIEVVGFAKKHPHFYPVSSQSVREECLKALEFVKKAFLEQRYDVLILDEVNIAVRDGFLKEEELLRLLSKRPDNMEVVLTGRGATQQMIEAADLVSYIKEVKHPYKKGVQRRKGIEF